MTAIKPLPQTLLIVTAPTVGGIPAAIAACRAGAWPIPADSTLPRITWLMRSGAIVVSASAARIAVAANCGAGVVESEPSSLPIGVRRAATIYDEDIVHLATILRHLQHQGCASR